MKLNNTQSLITTIFLLFKTGDQFYLVLKHMPTIKSANSSADFSQLPIC